MAEDVEAVVIGAGVVGLAIARALARVGREVLVLEQHDRTGAETSSRNSEVIHAGLYYTPGSLKAALCVRGREMLYRFAEESGVAVARRGKLVVAASEDERRQLDVIAATAERNGVMDLKRLEPADIRTLEPELTCVSAYLSPSTGVVDSQALMTALEGHLATLGGRVVFRTRVTGLSQDENGTFCIATQSGDVETRLTARTLVLAAGLSSTTLGRMLPGRPDYRAPETYLAKGHYYTLTGKAPFRHLVYPVPSGGSLGIHYTLDTGGQAKFGPDIAWTQTASYAFEDTDGARVTTFETSIRRYWPALPAGALQPGYTGLRPKLTRAGEPAADFAIHGEAEHGIPRFVALYGIESPGLTSSLAIGEHVCAQLQ